MFTLNSFEVRNRNTLARMANSLTNACNSSQTPIIPKWIVVVPEADVLETVNCNHYGISAAYGRITQYIMNRFDDILRQFLDHSGNLAAKINKFDWPFILWVEPTLHQGYSNNNLRIKYIRSLHNVAQFHERVVVLPLKQSWNEDIYDFTVNHRISPRGCEALWSAVDNTIKFADTKLMRNHGLKLSQVFQKDRIMVEAEQRISNFEKKMNQPHESTQHRQNLRLSDETRRRLDTLAVNSARFINNNREGNQGNQIQRRRRFPICKFKRCAKKFFVTDTIQLTCVAMLSLSL